jgi:hypothetical protein
MERGSRGSYRHGESLKRAGSNEELRRRNRRDSVSGRNLGQRRKMT